MKHDIRILRQAPIIIDMGIEMADYLPNGKERDKFVSIILKLKKNLIDLDVLIQDSEWNILEKHLKKEMNNANHKKFFSQGDDEIGISD
jgi:hypothetical protein